MIKFTLDLVKNELVLEMEPVHLDSPYEVFCSQPDPCPGCGQCRLCDVKCTCSPMTKCFMAGTCNEAGYCVSPGNCDDYSPWKLKRSEAASA